jgi:hypothetical protein
MQKEDLSIDFTVNLCWFSLDSTFKPLTPFLRFKSGVLSKFKNETSAVQCQTKIYRNHF